MNSTINNTINTNDNRQIQKQETKNIGNNSIDNSHIDRINVSTMYQSSAVKYVNDDKSAQRRTIININGNEKPIHLTNTYHSSLTNGYHSSLTNGYHSSQPSVIMPNIKPIDNNTNPTTISSIQNKSNIPITYASRSNTTPIPNNLPIKH